MEQSNFQWDLMIGQLRGIQFNNYGLQQIAELSCGEVIDSTEHLLLTQRLYTPTVMEKFAAM